MANAISVKKVFFLILMVSANRVKTTVRVATVQVDATNVIRVTFYKV